MPRIQRMTCSADLSRSARLELEWPQGCARPWRPAQDLQGSDPHRNDRAKIVIGAAQARPDQSRVELAAERQ